MSPSSSRLMKWRGVTRSQSLSSDPGKFGAGNAPTFAGLNRLQSPIAYSAADGLGVNTYLSNHGRKSDELV